MGREKKICILGDIDYLADHRHCSCRACEDSSSSYLSMFGNFCPLGVVIRYHQHMWHAVPTKERRILEAKSRTALPTLYMPRGIDTVVSVLSLYILNALTAFWQLLEIY